MKGKLLKVDCPYCSRPARLVGGAAIYPHRPDLFALKFWQCQPCNAFVGTHKNSSRHVPLGRLANAELRALKSRAHARFDPLWKQGGMSRSEAYAWAAEALAIPQNEMHIGMFDGARCEQLIAAIAARPG
ncbi:zinc-finger-containing protein [Variovorax sp. 278MFTsu5.1]|uniref:zinc-finger-containing protein n=1 Tax=Variovorax sp. 278MFTsu5.1 TaxID=3158366 RepID=UPI003AAC70EB